MTCAACRERPRINPGFQGMSGKKKRSLERISLFSADSRELRQHELNAGLYREVIAPENRHCGEGSVLALRVPALLERGLALALQGLAAHRGGDPVSYTHLTLQKNRKVKI